MEQRRQTEATKLTMGQQCAIKKQSMISKTGSSWKAEGPKTGQKESHAVPLGVSQQGRKRTDPALSF